MLVPTVTPLEGVDGDGVECLCGGGLSDDEVVAIVLDTFPCICLLMVVGRGWVIVNGKVVCDDDVMERGGGGGVSHSTVV